MLDHVELHRTIDTQVRTDLAVDFVPGLADTALEKPTQGCEVFIEALAATAHCPGLTNPLERRQPDVIIGIARLAIPLLAARELETPADAWAFDNHFGHVLAHDALLSIEVCE
ncbi:MAG: hypothetical protein AAGI37_12690 [Planctomycetota bacterium]